MAKSTSESDRDDLVAYLDGEADAGTRQEIEARLNREPALRAEVDALKRTWELLDHLQKPEPSPTFTTQTLSRLSALRPAASTATAPVLAPPVKRSWLIWAAVIVVAFVIGLLVGRPKSVPTISVDDPQLVKDLRVIDNLPLYAPVESYEFLLALDQPELFGADSVGP